MQCYCQSSHLERKDIVTTQWTSLTQSPIPFPQHSRIWPLQSSLNYQMTILRYPLARIGGHRTKVYCPMRIIQTNHPTTACQSLHTHAITTTVITLWGSYHGLRHGHCWVNHLWVYVNRGCCQWSTKQSTIPPLQDGYWLTWAGTNVFQMRDLHSRHTRKYCNQLWKRVYHTILETSLLSCLHEPQTANHFSPTDRRPDLTPNPHPGAVLTGFLQLWAGWLHGAVNCRIVYIQQFRPYLNTDDTNLGQLTLPPANANQATQSSIKHEARDDGARKPFRDGRSTPTSAGELVGSLGTAIKLCFQKWPDLRGWKQGVTLNSTLLNN